MKKILCFSLVFALIATGCGFVQLRQPGEELVAKMVGRRAGQWLAINHPEKACGTPNIEFLIGRLDPMASAEIRDFLSLIEVKDPVEVLQEKLRIQAAKEGFYEGLKLGGCK